MKKITTERNQRVYIQRLSGKEVDGVFKIQRGGTEDKIKEFKTLQNLKRAGFLTFGQYVGLFGERPYLNTDKIIFFRLNSTTWEKDRVIILPRKGKIHRFKIEHTLTNNENILQLNKEIDGDIIFDQNIRLKIKDPFEEKYLRPDGIILKENKICFIETDMGWERNAILIEKGNYYQKYIIQEMDKGNLGIEDVRLCFFTKTERKIQAIKKAGVFRQLELLNIIEYSVNGQ